MAQRDPDFDGDRATDGAAPPAESIAYYQRLVVNPFLALGILSATLALAVYVSRPGNTGRSPLLPAVLAGLLASYFSLQYHCLDCGATGMVHRWQRHACPKVRERWRTGFDFWARPRPTLRTQVAFWFLLVLIACFFAATLRP